MNTCYFNMIVFKKTDPYTPPQKKPKMTKRHFTLLSFTYIRNITNKIPIKQINRRVRCFGVDQEGIKLLANFKVSNLTI